MFLVQAAELAALASQRGGRGAGAEEGGDSSRDELDISRTELQLTKHRVDEIERTILGILIRDLKYILQMQSAKTIHSKNICLSLNVSILFYCCIQMCYHNLALNVSLSNLLAPIRFIKCFHPVFVDTPKLALSAGFTHLRKNWTIQYCNSAHLK